MIIEVRAIMAIDPGNVKSAWVLYEPRLVNCPITAFGHTDNRDLVLMIQASAADALAIEYFAPRGMPTAKEEMDTIFWSGRFVQEWVRNLWPENPVHPKTMWIPIQRRLVKSYICGSQKAKDSNIRRAIIDRFGGDAETRKGGKLKGLNSHHYQALGVAITALEHPDVTPAKY